MPFPFQQNHGRTAYCLLCLSANLFFSFIATAQQTGDTSRIGKHHRYYYITLFTGGAVQFFEKRNGLFTVSFPYTAVDVSGATTPATFSAQKRNIYGSARFCVAPLAFEMGWLHDFVHLELSLSLEKGSAAPGLNTLIGYGRICYVGRYAIKFSLNLSHWADSKEGDLLGTIDNHDKTLYILGWEAFSTFQASAGSSAPENYAATTLQIAYLQRETSLMPKVSLLPNPHRRKTLFELSIGYNVPIHDYGRLNFIQQGNSTSSGSVSNVIPGPNILNPSIAANYNNKPLKAPLYRFRGVYLELVFDVTGKGIK